MKFSSRAAPAIFDSPEIVADGRRIRELMGWSPAYDDLDLIVKTAWEWEQRLAAKE